MKPGIATTEFWVTLATAIIGILLVLGVVPGTFPQNEVVAAIEKIAGAVIAIFVALGYIKARTEVKKNGGLK